MPIPNDEAYRRISRSVKHTERAQRPTTKREKRRRPMGGGAAAETIVVPVDPETLVIKQFELTTDLDINSNSATARLLNENGSPSSATTVVHDSNVQFHGFAEYLGADGAQQSAFRGTAVQYVDDPTSYWVVGMDSLFGVIAVQLREDVEVSAGPIDADYLDGYVGVSFGSKVPPAAAGASGNIIRVYNTKHLADGASDNDIWFCAYDPASGHYELMAGRSTAGITLALLNGTILGTSFPDGDVLLGSGEATLLAGDGIAYSPTGGTIDVYNPSVTPIEGSSANPVVLICAKLGSEQYIVLNVMDFRGGPGFSSGPQQIWVHDESADEFELVDFCYKEKFVTEVVAEAERLFYKRVTDGLCGTEDVDIVAIGPCSSAPEAVITEEDNWRQTSFWN